MAYQKSKITVENESYEIAQAHDAQFKATSDDKDTSNSNTWTDIEPLEDEEINSNIFNKMSKMFSNVRYLYNELGGSGAITATSDSIQKKLDDIETTKIAKDHKHNTGTYNELKTVLPVVNYQNDSPHTIPTSSVLTAMNTAISDIQTNLATAQANYDKYFKKAPNERYRGKNLGVWNTTSDVDKFCSTYTSPNYTGLCLGDYVTIMDGTYNTQWMIAGFDTENTNSSNNGVGICMIPKSAYIFYTSKLSWVKNGSRTSFFYGSAAYNSVQNVYNTTLSKILTGHAVKYKILATTKINDTLDTAASPAITVIDYVYMHPLSVPMVFGPVTTYATDTYPYPVTISDAIKKYVSKGTYFTTSGYCTASDNFSGSKSQYANYIINTAGYMNTRLPIFKLLPAENTPNYESINFFQKTGTTGLNVINAGKYYLSLTSGETRAFYTFERPYPAIVDKFYYAPWIYIR